MASPYQQQALRRKLVYLGLIVALFTVAGIFRAFVVEAKAEELALREQNVGEVELGGSALQLSLTGSRGFVVCGLWYWAMDAQKKNRWNELELYCDSLTRLQPHFIRPWLFQSWNLSYNVYAVADQVKDKYFYASRGVELLGKGERKNHFNPEMRFNIGFYQQHKVMQSDETHYMRCLYQLSCIPPPDRDPAHFVIETEGNRTLDLLAFEKFCIAHPQLVRRLHDRLRCNTLEDVLHFLTENQQIPTIYKDDPEEAGPEWRQGRAPLRPMPERFPALPPPADIRQAELPHGVVELYDQNELSYDSPLDDAFDAHACSRAWYGYAQDAIPQPSTEWPGESAPITDRTRQRPARMTTNIFRNQPPQAQTFVGQRLTDEGWFGPEGWLITGWFPNDRFHDDRPALVGTGEQLGPKSNWSEETWNKAFAMWKRRGERSLMLLDDQTLSDINKKALDFRKKFEKQLGGNLYGPEPAEDSPDHDGWKAAKFMFLYDYSRTLPNFAHFYYTAMMEKDPLMIDARRTMFAARQSVRQGHRDQAAELFESETGLQRLRLMLETYPHARADHDTQEEFFELQVRYIKLLQDKDGGPLFKQVMAAGGLLGTGVPHGAAGTAWTGAVNLLLTGPSLLSNLPVPEVIPAERMRIDGKGQDGNPLIPDIVRDQVKAKHGLLRIIPQMMPPSGMMPPGASPPPGMTMGPGGGPPGMMPGSRGGPPPGMMPGPGGGPPPGPGGVPPR